MNNFERGMKENIIFVNNEILENKKLTKQQLQNIFDKFINDDYINEQINTTIIDLIKKETKEAE